MRVWRCVHQQYVDAAWTGEGARLHGGRWNRPGTPLVYASEHAALAVLEVLAGEVTSYDLEDWRLLPAEVPDDGIHTTNATGADVGATLNETGELARSVPSAVVPGENILLNPQSPRWAEIMFGKPVRMDPRLWD